MDLRGRGKYGKKGKTGEKPGGKEERREKRYQKTFLDVSGGGQ